MGDGKSTDSMENVQRKMILMQIADSEKSHFDDVIDGVETDNGWDGSRWKETENSVTATEVERIVPAEWVDQQPTNESMSVGSEKLEAPHSYYELLDLNREPVENSVRLARVPSQYQLDALSEMFIFDVPQHYAIQQANNCHQMAAINSLDQDNAVLLDEAVTPYFVNSEYVSELLM